MRVHLKQQLVNTGVFVSALRAGGGASRQILRLLLRNWFTLLLGVAHWSEYQDVLVSYP